VLNSYKGGSCDGWGCPCTSKMARRANGRQAARLEQRCRGWWGGSFVILEPFHAWIGCGHVGGCTVSSCGHVGGCTVSTETRSPGHGDGMGRQVARLEQRCRGWWGGSFTIHFGAFPCMDRLWACGWMHRLDGDAFTRARRRYGLAYAAVLLSPEGRKQEYDHELSDCAVCWWSSCWCPEISVGRVGWSRVNP